MPRTPSLTASLTAHRMPLSREKPENTFHNDSFTKGVDLWKVIKE